MMARIVQNQPARPTRRWPAPQEMAPHQAFIRSLPCLGCGKQPPSECAHIDVGTVSDRILVPLCGSETVWEDCCQSRLYFRGPRRFWSELGLDPYDLAPSLWRVSGNREAGVRIITLTRGRIALREHRP